MDLPITGSCGCGAVRYEVTEPFVSASYCHCTRCQRRTGTAASLNARAAPGAVRVTAGEERAARVGAGERLREALLRALRVGDVQPSRPRGDRLISASASARVDGDPGIRPQWHQFTAYAVPWQELPDDGLPRYPEAKPA